ncbi:MAG: glycosyltransferase [Phycisphaeraceae bacterium]|nr:glycosyltransferase [Phycisphaeraceae bacterium]
MAAVMDMVLLGLAIVVALPVGVLAVQVAAAVMGRYAKKSTQAWQCLGLAEGEGSAHATLPGAGAGVAVVMPAHDEEGVIGRTVGAIRGRGMLGAGDRLIVVADNCSDATAKVAREAGADVFERQDAVRRGKGYALAYGVEKLREDPREIVILADADTMFEAGAIEALARDARAVGVVQAIYVMGLPADPTPRDRISCLAFLVKNLVRPLGWRRLGLPCLITGSGFALRWEILDKAPLASGNIVEDMQLGLDLAVAGHSPRLCEGAVVRGVLPSGKRAAGTQRTRWEHGHVQTLLTQTPRLFWEGLRQMRPSLWGLAMELAVPPLALLCLGWMGVTVAAGIGVAAGLCAWPLWVAMGTGVVLAGAVVGAWARFGREVMPGRVLAMTPLYVAWKVPLYLAFLFKRQKAWVRTERK